MTEENGCCSGGSCGCHVDVYTTEEKCPSCGGRLRLSGRSQILELRLSCSSCGYQGPMLSQEELRKVL